MADSDFVVVDKTDLQDTKRIRYVPANRINNKSTKSARAIKQLEVEPATHKPVKHNTEIRCQEKAKGGLSFEMILAEPSTATPPKTKSRTPKTPLPLDEKLKAAEERRMSLEASKMATLAAQLEKVEVAAKKRDEFTSAFITQTKEALDQRMESTGEKREAHISSLKAKVKDHTTKLAEVRHSLETVVKVKAVEKDEATKNKLIIAEQNREKEMQKKLENIRKHERRAEVVRQNKERLSLQDEQTASSG